jgi:hypothetical protein
VTEQLKITFAALLLVMGLTGLGSPAAAGNLPAIAPATSCQAMRGFNPMLAGYPTQITDAREENGQCRVIGIISPQVRFEVRLPLKGWTQRYLQTGCGGLCGHLKIEAPQRDCPALQRGEFVLASTDMGHQGMGGTWGALDQQLRVDFAYRGVHATALVAKALIAQFYGQKPRYSYFSGCSDGGREGLMEAQRFPKDFDGIAAGAPAMNFLIQNSFHHAWLARSSVPDLKNPVLYPTDMPALHAAAIAACDAVDGVRDGLISDPLACHFDPRSAICQGGKTVNCLSSAAALAAANIYDGARDESGRKLEVGGLMPGSELAWPGIALIRAADDGGPLVAPPALARPGAAGGVSNATDMRGGAPIAVPNLPSSAMFASDAIAWLAFPRPLGPEWTLSDFKFDFATMTALHAMHGLYDATDPDLRRFAVAGGKLLVWHGLQDEHISPTNSIAYAQAVSDFLGAKPAAEVLRTFLIPGMYHCGSGDGLTSIDVLTPLMAWVEDGHAPDQVIASRSDADAAVGKGRPIFAFPSIGHLKAGADPDRPSNWVQRKPNFVPSRIYAKWLGADFFNPGFHRECGFDGEHYQCHPSS